MHDHPRSIQLQLPVRYCESAAGAAAERQQGDCLVIVDVDHHYSKRYCTCNHTAALSEDSSARFADQPADFCAESSIPLGRSCRATSSRIYLSDLHRYCVLGGMYITQYPTLLLRSRLSNVSAGQLQQRGTAVSMHRIARCESEPWSTMRSSALRIR
jgi:hypothetical protein